VVSRQEEKEKPHEPVNWRPQAGLVGAIFDWSTGPGSYDLCGLPKAELDLAWPTGLARVQSWGRVD